MDIKGNGVNVQVEAASQSDEWLINAATEIREAAQERGLEIPSFAGSIAVEGAVESEAQARAEFVPETKESIGEQLFATLDGNSDVIEALNRGQRKNNRFEVPDPVTVVTELEAWFTDEKLAYINEVKEANPEVSFTLVATPNVLATPKDVIKVAKAFGENQPYSSYVWDELYGKYSAEQLSGTDPDNGNAVNFSLIPSTSNPGLEGTVVEQRATLAKMQAKNPDLKVPSVLDAVTYWATLRAGGDKLADRTTFDKTYIRHFDLPEQRLDVWLNVPNSYVFDDGKPDLGSSNADRHNVARVAVG